ncbi:hypothetical protein ABPG74_005797 [Tetrahymena malaccensis]
MIENQQQKLHWLIIFYLLFYQILIQQITLQIKNNFLYLKYTNSARLKNNQNKKCIDRIQANLQTSEKINENGYKQISLQNENENLEKPQLQLQNFSMEAD